MSDRDKIILAELDIDLDALIKKQGQILQVTQELKTEQKSLRDSTANLADASDEELESYVKKEAEIKRLNKEYQTNGKVLAESATGVKGLKDLLDKEVKSMNDAKDQNKQLRTVRDQLDKTDKNYAKTLKTVNDKIDENDKFINKNSSSLEQQRQNIGKYSSALDNVAPGLSKFIGFLDLTRNAMLKIPIVALVAAFYALYKAFSSTQEGMDKINSLIAPLKGGFEAFIGVVQDLAVNIFGQLGDRFTLAANSITGNLNNIRILWNKLTGDEEEANALIEEQKGLMKESAEAQERINQKTAAFSQIVAGATDRMREGAKTQAEIERLTIAIERKQIDTTVALAKAKNELKANKQLAEDVSKTEQERLEALQEAVEQQAIITETEQEIIDLKIERLELEQSLNDTSREGELELQELKAQRYEAETAALENLTTLQNLRNTIINSQNAKELKAIADKKAEDEKRTAEAIANATKEAEAYLAERRRVAATRDQIDKAEFDLHRLNSLKSFQNEQQDRLNHGEAIKNIQLAEVDFRLEQQKELLKREAENRAQAILSEVEDSKERDAKMKLLYADTQYQLTLIEAEAIDERNAINKEALIKRAEQLKGYVNTAGDLLTGFIQEEVKEEQNATNEKIKSTEEYYDKRIAAAKEAGEDTTQLELRKEEALKKIRDDGNKELNRLNKIQKEVQISQAIAAAGLAIIQAYAQLGPIAGTIAAIAIGAATALQVRQIKNTAVPQFAKGGIQEIGGKRHSAGGTKFYGEDGSVFEAEAGEGIGILSRSAFSAFEAFNSMFTGKSGGSMDSNLKGNLERIEQAIQNKKFASYNAIFENDPARKFKEAIIIEEKRNR